MFPFKQFARGCKEKTAWLAVPRRGPNIISLGHNVWSSHRAGKGGLQLPSPVEQQIRGQSNHKCLLALSPSLRINLSPAGKWKQAAFELQSRQLPSFQGKPAGTLLWAWGAGDFCNGAVEKR